MFKALLRILGFTRDGSRAGAEPNTVGTERSVSTDSLAEIPSVDTVPTTRILKGKCYVIDGDTIVISGTKIRIAGIDAPELDHPWGKKSKYALVRMCKGKVITAEIKDHVSYDRIVAACHLPDGPDIAAELVKLGLALDWPKFSGGQYRHLEPEGTRKKLWRSAAKHKGWKINSDA